MSDTALADQLEGTRAALRSVFGELADRDIQIAALEAELRDARAIAAHATMLQWRCTALETAIHETLRLHAAGCGDAVSNLAETLDK
jgi:cytochrome P450